MRQKPPTQIKGINEIWWIAVDSTNCALWRYLEGRRRDVIERLVRDWGQDWRRNLGWRIAKLHVYEECSLSQTKLYQNANY